MSLPALSECSMKMVRKVYSLLQFAVSFNNNTLQHTLFNEFQVTLILINAACELNAIRNVLQVNRALVQSKMYGYEGSDVFDIIKVKVTKQKNKNQISSPF